MNPLCYGRMIVTPPGPPQDVKQQDTQPARKLKRLKKGSDSAAEGAVGP